MENYQDTEFIIISHSKSRNIFIIGDTIFTVITLFSWSDVLTYIYVYFYTCKCIIVGKVEPGCPLLNGHKSPVMDLTFAPFNSNILATASSGEETCILLTEELM